MHKTIKRLLKNFFNFKFNQKSSSCKKSKSKIDKFTKDLEEIKEISPVVKNIFYNAIKMSKLTVSHLLLPRNQVNCFNLLDPIEKNLEIARKSSHTRFPLIEGDLDKTIGIIHIKDLFRYQGDLKRLNLRNIIHVCIRLKETESVNEALKKLLRQRIHMALVVDEFGGTIGILPLEHILEELVGEIRDEFDATEEANICLVSENVMRISGLTPLHELEEVLEIQITSKEACTFGGYITATLGRIPEKGEIIKLLGLVIIINEVNEKRIISITIHRKKKINQN